MKRLYLAMSRINLGSEGISLCEWQSCARRQNLDAFQSLPRRDLMRPAGADVVTVSPASDLKKLGELHQRKVAECKSWAFDGGT
jgi:hypothetical protein